MACNGELEFEAPLARFDVEDWTEFYEEQGSPTYVNNSESTCKTNCLRKSFVDDFGALETGMSQFMAPARELSSGSSGCGNFAEQFGDTSLSGSLEDLVNTFDESVTKCCKSYEEQVERLAPVQVRTEDDVIAQCQSWYTLTGTFGTLLPINWSQNIPLAARFRKSGKRVNSSQGMLDDYEDDIEEDEEQFCSVEELDRLTGEMLNSIQPSGFEDDDALEPLDNADDVIDELEALMEEKNIVDDEGELSPTLFTTLTVTEEVPKPMQTDGGQAWLLDNPDELSLRSRIIPRLARGDTAAETSSLDRIQNDIQKLSVVELKQLSVDLARAVVDYNNALRQELAMSDELKYENRLSRDFITLTLSIQRKRRQQEHLSSVAADEEVDLDVLADSCSSGTYLSTVIPYRPSEGRPTVQRLQIYITILLAIEDDSVHVPRLLTDYILNALCPLN